MLEKQRLRGGLTYLAEIDEHIKTIMAKHHHSSFTKLLPYSDGKGFLP
jgi:hypothetical protein